MKSRIIKLLSDKKRHTARNLADELKPKFKTTKIAVNTILLELQKEGLVLKKGSCWRIVTNYSERKPLVDIEKLKCKRYKNNRKEVPSPEKQEKKSNSLLRLFKHNSKPEVKKEHSPIEKLEVPLEKGDEPSVSEGIADPINITEGSEAVDIAKVSLGEEPEASSDLNEGQLHISNADAATLVLKAINGQNQLSHKAKMAPLFIKLLKLVALEKGEQMSHMLHYVKELALPLVLEQLDYKAVDILTDDTGKVLQPLRKDYINNPELYLTSLTEVLPHCPKQLLYKLLESNWLSYVINSINQREFTDVQIGDIQAHVCELYGYGITADTDVVNELPDSEEMLIVTKIVSHESHNKSDTVGKNKKIVNTEEDRILTMGEDLESLNNSPGEQETERNSNCINSDGRAVNFTSTTVGSTEIKESTVQEEDEFPSDIFGKFVPILVSLRKNGVITEATIVKQFGGGKKGNRNYGRFSNQMSEWNKQGLLPFKVNRYAKSEGIEFTVEEI